MVKAKTTTNKKLKIKPESDSSDESSSDESSSDESSSDESEKKEPIKKRGRPRKNASSGKSLNVSKLLTLDKKEGDGDIILHLKISDDTSDKAKKNLLSDINATTTVDKVKLESDSDLSSNRSFSNLIETIKQRDKLIKNLTAKIESYEKHGHSIGGKKHSNTLDVVSKPIDLKLIDCRSGKSVVVNSTKTVCWWCTEPFKSSPCFIPERVYNNVYYVFGCFCSYNCAYSYALDMKDGRSSIRISLLKNLHKAIFGTEYIKEASQKEILTKFGGTVTIAKFRENFSVHSKQYKMKIPGLIPLVSSLDEITRDVGKLDKK